MPVPIPSRARQQAALLACTVVLTAAAVFAATPRPLADVPIPSPTGKPINLKQYRGKVVLMAVISQECAPCLKSIDILNRAQKEFGAQGFQVIAAVGDANAQYTLGAFTQRYRPAYPVGYLNQDQIIQLGGFTKSQQHAYVPIFIFIDRKGIVQFQVTGESPFFKDEENQTRQTVQALLKQ
jgi:peroxiredoxin